MAGNVLSRLGGLHGERLHFGRNDGKTPARFAGPRRFDGRVEGEKICLPGDVLDQLDDVTDLLRGLCKPRVFIVCRFRLAHRVADDCCGLGQLLIDFCDRCRQFLG